MLWPGLPLWMEAEGAGQGAVCRDICEPARLTCFVYPGAVPIQLALNLLLPPQFHECSPVLHSLSLFGEFPVDEKDEMQEYVMYGEHQDKEEG